jgi:hypothetical protein
MLKIKDASGKTVGVLKDEDSEPTMDKQVGALANPEEEVVETKEGEENGDSDDGNV